MTANNFDDTFKQSIDAIPREIQPSKDLWTGIELALEQQANSQAGTKKRFPAVAMAASVALVGVLSWFNWKETVTVNSDGTILNGKALVSAMSEQHEDQKQALLVQYTDVPKVVDNWQDQMQELDDAANAIRAALEEDPDNKALLRMLQNVHHQQIALIERAHAPKWQQT